MYDIVELKKKKLQDLQEIAEKLEISEIKNYKKLNLIYEILDKQAVSSANSGLTKQHNKTKTEKPVKTEKKDMLHIVNKCRHHQFIISSSILDFFI